MMTYIEVEHCDLYSTELERIMISLNNIAEKEEKTYEECKRLRNILDDLAMYNITFRLEDINMLQYTLISSFMKSDVQFIRSVGFEVIDFKDNELNEMYDRLMDKAQDLLFLLTEKYKFRYETIEYILPNSMYVDVSLSISIKELIEFIHTCSKYDELMDIVLAISENELLEQVVTIANSLYDFIHTDDVFIRTAIGDEVREDLTTHGTNIMVLSNTDFIRDQIEHGNAEVKMSTLVHCSLVAFRDLINKQIDVKLENFKYRPITSNEIILPREYGEIDEDDLNLIDKYIYDWVVLIDKIEQSGEYYSTELALCNLGCFGHIVRINAKVWEYFFLEKYNIIPEVEELVSSLTLKI